MEKINFPEIIREAQKLPLKKLKDTIREEWKKSETYQEIIQEIQENKQKTISDKELRTRLIICTETDNNIIKYLMMYKKSKRGNFWEFPKGGIENTQDKTILEGSLRERTEETNKNTSLTPIILGAYADTKTPKELNSDILIRTKHIENINYKINSFITNMIFYAPQEFDPLKERNQTEKEHTKYKWDTIEKIIETLQENDLKKFNKDLIFATTFLENYEPFNTKKENYGPYRKIHIN
ncbi:NUDIX domain-containing protein [Candidatus Woesearchaeota archaeon]|nr:NUDIX domain-containing protein [Candidatus Woesearchaeota archaeon]